ncbi:Pc22g13360 [Penicillium rubens Wisconsin 54-1255]|uniref:Pc22g13360 protein n=1 Tax=Penicillium rubens (strain ATCC 28089 / DSM 1075 / NRRL 1951 / Wisconsin 54-1255) TaxID=500485 RepID=B6HT64_PENRW|nr:Pc22g13360 [Penicillium rubens Wisconsin 54-1255]
MDTNPKPFRDLLDHHRDLFVDPLLWTYRHLKLVGCRFEDADTASTESTQDDCKTDDDERPCPKVPSDAEQLATYPIAAVKYRCLVNILVGKGRPFKTLRKGPQFYFTDKPVHRPRHTVFYRQGQSDAHFGKGLFPLVSYLHYTSVNGGRRDKFEPCPGPKGTLNWIGQRILEKRLAQIQPKEWTEDPYFSRLLVTNLCDKEYIHLYEAEISAELLGALRSPTTATKYTKWPTIRRRKLPYKPYNTFADRITAELVAPSLLCSPEISSLSDEVNGVVRCGTKRPSEPESNKTYKTERIT